MYTVYSDWWSVGSCLEVDKHRPISFPLQFQNTGKKNIGQIVINIPLMETALNSHFIRKAMYYFCLFHIPFTLWSEILDDIVFLKLLKTMQFFALF